MNATKTLLASVYVMFAFILSLSFAGNLTVTLNDMVTMDGIEGVTAYIYDDSDNVLVAQQNSGADGRICVQGLNGNYVIRTVREGYANGYFTAHVGASQSVDAGNLLLVPLATLTLSVQDNASAPLDNGIVKVMQNGDVVVAQVNGASGTVQVSPGDYVIIFSAPFHTQQPFHVSLLPGESMSIASALKPTQVDTFPSVGSVTATLSTASQVDAGTVVKLRAVAHYTDSHDEDVTAVAQWDMDGAGAFYMPELIATVYGTHNIRAVYNGRSDTKPLSVRFGDVRSLDVRASATSIYTGQTSTLTSYVLDQYSNSMATTNVNYSTTCGTVQGSVFSSGSTCTAVITGVYTANASMNDSVTITVSQRDSGTDSHSSSGSYHSKSSSTNTSTSTAGSNTAGKTDKTNGTATTSTTEEIKSIKFVFPPTAYVGDTVEVSVLDEESNPVSGVVISVKRPDGTAISLVSSKDGKVSFVVFAPGDYKLSSSKYTVIGSDTLTAKPIPVIEKPPHQDKQSLNTTSTVNTGLGEAGTYTDRGIVDTIVAAFTGEISPVDAIKATLPLWLIVGGVMFAAAIFFVVYTFLAGNAPPENEPKNESADQRVAVLHAVTAPAKDELAGMKQRTASKEPGATAPARSDGQESRQRVASKEPASAAPVKSDEPATGQGRVGGDVSGHKKAKPEGRVEDEIAQLEHDLEEKMQRLKELKRSRGQ